MPADGAAVPTHQRLLASAEELLDGGGPAAVTLREVGRLAGVSHNAPYKHFADKAALLAAVAAAHLDALTAALRRAGRRRDATDDLAAAGHAYIRWARRHPERFRIVFGRWEIDDERLGEAATEAREAFARPFAEAAASGRLTVPAEVAAALVWASAHGAVDLELSGHLHKDGPKVRAEDLVTALADALTGSPVAARGGPGRR